MNSLLAFDPKSSTFAEDVQFLIIHSIGTQYTTNLTLL